MTREEKADIRRVNLRRFVERHMEGNLSELARRYGAHMGGREPRPTFFSDVLRKAKGFGETLAEAVESAIRLKPGQLSLPDSPLELLEPMLTKPAEQLKAEVDALDAIEAEEVLSFIQELKSRRKIRRRAIR